VTMNATTLYAASPLVVPGHSRLTAFLACSSSWPSCRRSAGSSGIAS
jgi:hypothetical protein